MDKQEVLKQCTVSGNVVNLPPMQLERKLYQDVAKSLELIGGKWKGGKVMGFVFQEDPTEMLYEIANGEKRNLKKEFQFFATPEKLADYLVELAEIKQSHTILEPSAGQGAIIKSIWKVIPEKLVFCCELMDINRKFLQNMGTNVDCIASDFMEYVPPFLFDRIIANPPFTKNQDIYHLLRMYEFLKVGGRLVCITSESWVNGSQKIQCEFIKWLKEVNATILDIEKGSFKESGTMVGGKIIIIDKLTNH
jgi:hypothetical protein